MDRIDFRSLLLEYNPSKIYGLWKECTPRVLVLTDGLDYTTSDFGLTQFVKSIAASTIHGMTPKIVKASRFADSNADIQNFDFADATNGIAKSRYDVVFLFGVGSEGFGQLPQPQIDAIAKFMQDGGGVFATGDHESLGAAMSRDIPRVRSMRFWKQADTPDVGNTSRLSTNLPGDDGVYGFGDQSDVHPQRLYVNYRTKTGGIGNPHPLLDGGPLGAIEVFPDHPHEGECRIPALLDTKFELGGAKLDEWPVATAKGGRVVPEMVALSMSHGDSFPGKDAIVPRSFIAIAAYDGHRAKVGRVATDATWHHFVNVNLDGSGSPGDGLQNPPGTDTPDLTRIRQYYVNLATWLMPQNVRKCLRFPWLLLEMKKYPLFEELVLPNLETARGEELRAVGEHVSAAFAHRLPAWQSAELLRDALIDAVGEEQAENLDELGCRFGRLSARDIALAALGALTIGTVSKLAELKGREDADPHAIFDPMAKHAAKLGAQRYVHERLPELRELDGLMTSLCR